MLSDRERWLVIESYKAGYEAGHNDAAENGYTNAEARCLDWLDESISDGGHTVEMLLSYDATRRTRAN
jgi:hypothetical protein